jgi:hypothetical protein
MRISKSQESFAWPARSRLNFYDGWRKLKFSTTERLYDLADGLMLNWERKSRTIYLGLSTKSNKFKKWNSETLGTIEDRIKYDLKFDGYSVTISRVTSKLGEPCTYEFIWKLKIRNYDL